MPNSRLAAAALIAAGALWAQLVLIPLVAGAERGGFDLVAGVVGALALLIPIAAVTIAQRREGAAVTLMLAGFPTALGLYGLIATRQPFARFDVAARIIAAITSVVFSIAGVAWARSLTAIFPVTVAAMEKRPDTPKPPPLRREVFGLLVAMAAFLAIVAPAIVTAHAPITRAERVGGESLLRAREAVTSAGGLALALALVLGAGSSLLRRQRTDRRRATHGLAYLLWSAAVFGLDWLIRTQR